MANDTIQRLINIIHDLLDIIEEHSYEDDEFISDVRDDVRSMMEVDNG